MRSLKLVSIACAATAVLASCGLGKESGIPANQVVGLTPKYCTASKILSVDNQKLQSGAGQLAPGGDSSKVSAFFSSIVKHTRTAQATAPKEIKPDYAFLLGFYERAAKVVRESPNDPAALAKVTPDEKTVTKIVGSLQRIQYFDEAWCPGRAPSPDALPTLDTVPTGGPTVTPSPGATEGGTATTAPGTSPAPSPVSTPTG